MHRSRLTLFAVVAVMAMLLSTITVLSIRWLFSPVSGPSSASGVRPAGFARKNLPAPRMSLPSLSGTETIRLTDLGRRPIVLNFWASFCGPCRSEASGLASTARALAGKVTFVGVDTEDVRAAAVAFTTKHHVPYRIVFDPAATAATRFGVPGLPVTLFISPSGTRILGENIGALTARGLRRILRELYHIT